MYGTIALAISVLALKGAGPDGGFNPFRSFVNQYIEETSASIFSNSRNASEYQMADITGLMAWNSVSPTSGASSSNNSLSTIQDNAIFAHSPTAVNFLESNTSQRASVIEYTVQPGDNLTVIASDYGVSVESIMWANGLTNAHSIREGRILKIPPMDGVIHTVAKGDTVSKIASKYGAKAEEIIAYNGLPQEGDLQINAEIIVPGGKIARSAVTAAGSAVSSAASTVSRLIDLGSYFAHPLGGLGRITQWLHGRNGIDIANAYGTPIKAAADGTVVAAFTSGYNGGYGLYVKIKHPNGTDTLYAHMSKVLVRVGETVAKGQTIGNIGSTGRSTGPHLHFEVHGAKNPLSR